MFTFFEVQVQISLIITALGRKLDFSTHIELSGVENGNEFMIVEKNSCLQLVSYIAWRECGQNMNVKVNTDYGMVNILQAECELCSEKNTSPGEAIYKYDVRRTAVTTGWHCKEEGKRKIKAIQEESRGESRKCSITYLGKYLGEGEGCLMKKEKASTVGKITLFRMI